MNIFNINVPKDSISMIFDEFNGAENYNTTLYLHKSKIIYDEEGNKYSAKLEIDLDQNSKKDKLVKQIFNKEYGSYIITFINADFSTAENAYYSFFIYYGLEGFNSISEIKEKFPLEYKARYISTKSFLDYYNKAFELVKTDYIKFQKDISNTVDYVFNLHGSQSPADLDRVSKFMAYSTAANLLGQFTSEIRLGIVKSFSEDIPSKFTNIKQVENLAYDIANKKISNTVGYLYESKSHFALAYIALNDLIQNSKRNIRYIRIYS